MTSDFPLLKLPLIPLERIIEQLDFLDLVRLSMKSTKLKCLLELLKLSVQTLHVFITERLYRIKILQNQCCFYIDVHDSVPVDTNTELANIQSEHVQIWNHGRDEVKVKSDLSKLATLEAITKYILSISKVKKYSLNYDDAETEIRSLFIWQITTQLDKFDIFPYHGSHVPISPEDLTFVLDRISIKSLFLNGSCPGFKYQRPIRHPEIHIHRPRWIDFNQFLPAPETITANFSDQKISNDVLNRLMKGWTKGKNPKLREIKFTWGNRDPESLAMARKHETRPHRPILPNQNIEQLKGLSINLRMKHRPLFHSVYYYEVLISVEEDFGLNGIHLDDQN